MQKNKNKNKNQQVTTAIAKKETAPIQKPPIHNGMYIRFYGIIIAVLLVLYAQTFGFGFVAFDDITFIIEGKEYFQKVSHFWEGFVKSYWPVYYRPILFGTFIFDYQMGGADPLAYHISSFLFHLIACLLLFRFLILLEYNQLSCLLTTLVFAVHPLMVQAVAWISGRNDSILTIFVLLALNAFLLFLKTKSIQHYFLHLLWLSVAFFTKETAVGIIIICFAYLFLFKPFTDNKKIYRQLMLPWIVIIGVYFLMRKTALDSILEEISAKGLSISGAEFGIDAFLRSLPFLSESISKLFLPMNLSVFPSFTSLTTAVGIGVYILLAIILIVLKLPIKKIIWIVLWWFLFITPSMLIANMDGKLSDYLEHRVYLPAIAWVIFLNEVMKKRNTHLAVVDAKNIKTIVFSAIIVIFSVISFFHIQNFRDGISFWTNAAKYSPQHADPWRSLANQLYEKGKHQEAIECWMKSYTINPKNSEILSNLGTMFANQNNYDSALFFYEQAVSVNPQKWESWMGLGVIYENKKMLEKAKLCYENTIKLNPQNARSYFGLGVIAYNEQQYEGAEKYLQQAITIEPENTNSYLYLTAIALLKQDITQAKKYADILKSKGVDVKKQFPNYPL